MPKYTILWVDDDWGKMARSDERKLLEKTYRVIHKELLEIGIRSEVIKVSNLGEALIELHKDIHIVVLDYSFPSSRYTIINILPDIIERKIPYIIFTGYIETLRNDPHIVREDRYRINIYQKDKHGTEKLVNRLKDFFGAPPFRILHLSDFHLNSYAIKRNKKYREHWSEMISSLNNTVKEEHKKRPIDCIAITGDLSSKKPSDDLYNIRDIIVDIVDNTISAHKLSHLFIVPGNHDVNWQDFRKKNPSDKPWWPYLEFYSAIYGSNIEILSEMGAWNGRLFNAQASNDDLLWHRYIKDIHLNLVGISTPATNSDFQGDGIFTKAQQKYINEKWGTNKSHGEVRIALMHHNLFATLSLSIYDKKSILQKSGDAMYTFMNNKCDIILSGHTHTSNFIKCSAGKLGLNGYNNVGKIIVSSTGTTGGLHKEGDRPRSFNIIDIFDADHDSGSRPIIIRPFLYEATEDKWKEFNPIIDEA